MAIKDPIVVSTSYTYAKATEPTQIKDPSLGQKWGLRQKTVALVLAVGTIPVLGVGGVATVQAWGNITDRIYQEQLTQASVISETLSQFALDRIKDIETIAHHPYLTRSGEPSLAGHQQAIDFIDGIVERDDSYGLIAVANIQGGLEIRDGIPLTSTKGRDKLLPRLLTEPTIFIDQNIDFFVQARERQGPAIIPLRVSASSGNSSFYVSAPAFKEQPQEMAYIIYSRTDDINLATYIQSATNRLLPESQTTLSRSGFPGFLVNSQDNSDVSTSQNQDPGEQNTSALPSSQEGLRFKVFVEKAPSYFEIVDGEEKEISVSQLEDGRLLRIQDDTELILTPDIIVRDNRVFASDDGSGAGSSITDFFPDIPELIEANQATTFETVNQQDQQRYLVTYFPVASVGDLPLDWGVVVYEPTQAVFADRRLLALSFAGGTGIVAIIVGLIAANLSVRATRPIVNAIKTVQTISGGDFKSRMEVKGSDELAILGQSINQMAAQIEDLLAQQEQARKTQLAQQELSRQLALREQLQTLTAEIEGAATGDLTVRAHQTTGEIGVIAEFFNNILENLRTIVTRVKSTTTELNRSLSQQETTTSDLSDKAIEQVTEISKTLASVEQMNHLIGTVLERSTSAAQMARQAETAADQSSTAMKQTVEGILTLRDTMAETAKKVKRLGESSQRISKVVSLINQIALQTNVLAINAGIEAARAGEEGRGFAVVAEEVGVLAAQSANATKEIEKIVESIRSETSEVVEAMDKGTTEVVLGTELVEQAEQNLSQFTAISQQIGQLVTMISDSTASQAEISAFINALMRSVAAVSQQSSESSRSVSEQLQQTMKMAEELLQSVETFKS